MNELQNVDKLTAEILILKQQTATNIIEIGKRLTAVKSSMQHGDWCNYLKEKVDFTERTAQNFMRVAKEFSNTKAIADLGITKVYALLDLPANEREDFVKENNVSEMSTRQLQQAIKEKKEAEKKAFELQVEKSRVQDNLDIYKSQLHQARINEEIIKKDLEQLKEKKVVEKIVEKEVVKEVIPQDYESIKARVKELEEEKRLNQKEAAEYERLKNQIEKLKDKKDDFNRKLQSISELSELSAKVDEFIKTVLAQIKYCRAVQEQSNNQIVQRNLREIVNKMQKWCDDMYPLINSKIIDVEVNVNE